MIEAVTIRAGLPDPETGKPMSVKATVSRFLARGGLSNGRTRSRC